MTTNTKKITEENFDATYTDSIEIERVDKFVCDEMDRQIHRYIKAMHGSKRVMDNFISHLKTLDSAGRETAIARYIDFNRKAVSGLDLKIVLTRAYANYCDTYDFFVKLLSDKAKFDFYLHRIREKYLCFHEVFEQDGKFGIMDARGNILVHPRYDFLRRVFAYVDDLAPMPIIAQREGKFGLILPDGCDTRVTEFVYDDIALLDEPPFFEGTRGGVTLPIETSLLQET